MTGVTNFMAVASLGRLVAWGVDGARSSCLQELRRAVQDAMVHQAFLGLAKSLFHRGGGSAQGGFDQGSIRTFTHIIRWQRATE